MAQAPDDVEYEERQEDKPTYNVRNPKASYIQIGDGSEIHDQRININASQSQIILSPNLAYDRRSGHLNYGDGYEVPVSTSVTNAAASLHGRETDNLLSAVTGQQRKGECPQLQVESRSSCRAQFDWPLEELTEKFCRTKQVQEREEFAKRIRVRLNCFSVDNTESCNVQLSEKILRFFFLQNDQYSIEARINIYCLHLVLMLQRGLQPETVNKENKGTVDKLLRRLKNMVKPSAYCPTSSLRKDIENVIDMLSLYSTKSSKHQILPEKITECFLKMTSDSYFNENNVNCLIEYLKPSTWIHLYLVISWLKTKVLADRGNENHLHNVLAVITCYAKSLHKKNDQNFQWKFTITVVETLTAFINQKSEEDLVSQKSLAALIEFYEVLKRKKKVLKVCLDIFYKKARLLLYINNLQIRGTLFEKIFEPTNFDISSHEMTKERLKGSKTLINLKEIRVHHDGRNAVIFLATYMGSLVVVKCLKLSKEGLLKKHDDPNPTHFSYELEFLRSLKMKPHPNIIQLIEFDHHLKCLALEYVAHGSLRRYLLNHRSKELLSFKELILIAAKIAGALNFLEEEGIIHLALQARNVLVDNDGDVKLTGFQFCRRPEQVKDGVGLRNAILKPHFKWLDPQALLYQSVHPRTVSWSFGVFLYELLTYGCEPYSRIKRHTEVIEQYLDSSEARVYVLRGGVLPKEACIPHSCYKIISERCCRPKYSDRIAPCDLHKLLIEEMGTSKLINIPHPPPIDKDISDIDNHDPGTSPYADELPYSHLDVIDSYWNYRNYSIEEIEAEERDDYINPDTSVEGPVLGIMRWNETGVKRKEIVVVEYMNFEDIKLVEQLQQLDCPELVNVLHVNRFGPTKLEMISESFPAGNIRDALISYPTLRDNSPKYIQQAGSAVMYLHSQGIVHRKIKLENFLLCNENQIKLGRLGMSLKELHPNAIYNDPKEKDHRIKIIDPRWNAPEVLQLGSFTRESDVWSFGVVIWEFLRIWTIPSNEKSENVLPFGAMSDDQVYKYVTDGNILEDPDPRQLSSHKIYCFVCSRCWQWKTNHRPTIRMVVQELNKLLELPALGKIHARGRIENQHRQMKHFSDSKERTRPESVSNSSGVGRCGGNPIYAEPYKHGDLEHMSDIKETTHAESVSNSSGLARYYGNLVYAEPHKKTVQEDAFDPDGLYTPLAWRSLRDVESNSYASLIESSPPTNETDSINDDHQFETEIKEVYMSQGSLTNVSIVSDAMVPSVKQLREKFENAKFNN